MIVDIIVLVILGIACCVGLGFIMFIQFRTIWVVERQNTPQEFSVLSPMYHMIIGFLGFSVTLALLIGFTATEIAEVWVRVLFGVIAFCFGVLSYISTRYRIDFSQDEAIKRCFMGSKTFKISDFTKKRVINMGFCTIVYTKKGRAFAYNQNCIGSEYLDELIKDLPEASDEVKE